MSDKKYCAVNVKYYKNSNASGEIGHVLRLFKKNKNTFEELLDDNFGHCYSENNNENTLTYYKRKLNEAKALSPKAFKRSSTTFIDSVLVFDRDLMESILNEDDGKEKIENSIKEYMSEFKEKYGYEPLGFNFHCDEGTFIPNDKFQKLSDEEKKYLKPVKNPETGEDGYLKRNLHAQAIFLNFDFNERKSVHRLMKRKDWQDTQDLLHKHFKQYGFDRGEPKQTNNKDHLTKSDYVKKLKEEIAKNEEIKQDFDKLKSEYSEILDDIIIEGTERELIDKELENYNNLQVLAKTSLKALFSNTPFKNIVKYIEKKEPKVFKYIKKKGSELLELLDIKPSDFLPKPKQNLEVEANQPEPQPVAAQSPEPEPEPEELTLTEQMKLDESKVKEKLGNMSIEEKKAEVKKQNQKRKYGKRVKN